MNPFVPHFIWEQFQKGHNQGVLRAFTMFIDLSGFTALTEKLMRKGPEGAEELSYALNRIFEPTVHLVYAHGGFIPYFAGDSFIGIFPIPDDNTADHQEILQMAARVMLSARGTLARFLNHKDADKVLTDNKIGVKIGLSEGEVAWGIVGNDHKTFYFRGEPIDGCAQAQTWASSLAVVADINFHIWAAHLGIKATEVQPGYFKLEKPEKFELPDHASDAELLDTTASAPFNPTDFLPEAVLDYKGIGEFRNVVTVFISFKEVNGHEALHHFATILLDEVMRFSGYLKEVDFGDKGGVAVCLFGAPISFENNTDRALEFVASIREELRELSEKIGMQYRIGLTSGVAFTGIIGGAERSQYAAVGARVNLCSRLMMAANWDEVVADENVQRNRNFKFTFKGEINYKGFEASIPTYSLTGRNMTGQSNFTGACIGRKEELHYMIEAASPLKNGQFAGVFYLFGEAGVGKSRLCFEFMRQLKDSIAVSWFNCQSDQILRKPFNPFIYFLKNYFDQSPDNSDARNRDLFEKNFLELMYDLAETHHPEADELRREIARTQSILGAMMGIHYEGSLWEQLDGRGRYQNGMAAMATLFIAESVLQPAIIELEDGHWYDDMSREFLAGFMRRAKNYPIMILVTSRFEDDGSKTYLVRQGWLQELGISYREIDLNVLNPGDLKAFAEARLGGNLHPDLLELLQRMTQGNPFYVEQMAEYFLESKLLKTENGVLALKNKDIQITDSVKQIMMARIDRLSGLVKETVKAAAVIGREFELPVLSAVMAQQAEFIRTNGNYDNVLKEQIQTAEKWQIWHAMNELRYIFRHSLLREAAYDMQLRTRLRELHLSIANAIEELYPQSEERYVDLAFHYEQAEQEKKTNKYLEKAARFAQKNFQNRQALGYYEKLIENLRNSKNKSKKIIRFLMRKGAVNELTGQWDAAAADYLEALELAKGKDDFELLARANRRLGHLQILKGNYAEAKKYLDVAISCYQLSDDSIGLAKSYGNLGNFYFRQGLYDDAKEWFTKAIDLNRSVDRAADNAFIVANLGLVYMNKGNYDEGIQQLEFQLDISEAAEDKQGQNILYTNLGIIYLEKGSLDNALLCLEKGLALSEELGNKLQMTICIGCIGSVWEKKGDYTKAMQMFERDLALAREMGDKQGIAIAAQLIGDLHSTLGDFDQSIEYLELNMALSNELKYKKGMAKALNTLGDTWFYKGDLEKSIGFYTQASAVARDMGNKLVLGYTLIEKGIVLLHAGNIAAARQSLDEGRAVAQELHHEELRFGANILKGKIYAAENNDTEAGLLFHQLLAMAKTPREEAAVYYELSKMKHGSDAHRRKAYALYRELYERSPQYLYKKRLEKLENEGMDEPRTLLH